MTILLDIFTWCVESVILGFLLWEHTRLHEMPCIFLPLLPLLLFHHWWALRRERLAPSLRRKLLSLTGPCVLLSLSLVLSLSVSLRRIAIVGGGTKEMVQASINERVPPNGLDQWMRDSIERMKSERLIYAMLLASMCLLYGSRWSTAKRDLSTSKEREKLPPGVIDELI
jgi:hypothetical protein